MQNRIVFADWLRVVACFLVMLCHAAGAFYEISNDSVIILNDDIRLSMSVYDGMSRVAVPLFMVVSSFLLVPLKQDVSMLDFYKKRFLRIVPPVIMFMLFYSLAPLLWGGTTWEHALNNLSVIPLSFPARAGHLWFIYPLISLYIIIPIISPWLERASAKEERIFLCFFVVSTFQSWLHLFCREEILGECGWNRFSMLWYCSGYLGYLVLAHYVRVHLSWSISKRMTIGTVCFLVGTLFTMWSFWIEAKTGVPLLTKRIEWGFDYSTPNVLCATFGAFVLFTCIQKPQAPKIVVELSKLSFGMYLMHVFVLRLFVNVIIADDISNPIIPVGFAIPVIAMLTFICCYIGTKIISLLPGSKWVIGC